MKNRLTVCACCSRSFIDKEKVARLAAVASVAGWDVRIVADLCELAEEKNVAMKEIAGSVISACHERAVKSLVQFCGEEPNAILNNRVDDVESQIKMLKINTAELNADEVEKKAEEFLAEIKAMPQKWGADAWFPTIDKDVCGECGKCLDFCPFGVYEMVEDRVRVVNPRNCKNNCPACARTCPACAVIFPKYERAPINGGVEKEERAVQIDTKTLYAQAFKERLEERKKMAMRLRK